MNSKTPLGGKGDSSAFRRKNNASRIGQPRNMTRPSPSQPPAGKSQQHRSKSWDAVADWYSGWSGAEGSHHHKEVAIPALIDLLQAKKGEKIIDLGCGAGAPEPAIRRTGAAYTGIDLSPKLIEFAKRHHKESEFHVGDATRLTTLTALRKHTYDGALFLLSLQDINPLEDAIESTAWVLKPSGRLAILMIHPCFRIPRQSGWGWDDGRQLRFRRIDRYLTPLDVPMQEYSGGKKGTTRSYHRPLQVYVDVLADAGFVIERLRELPAPIPPKSLQEKRADRLAREQIPMFLGIMARLCSSAADVI